MKKYILISSVIVFAMLVFVSCEKESEVIVLPANISPSSQADLLEKFFDDNLVDATQSITVNTSSTNSFTSNKGISYTFGSNTFITPSGNPVSGNFTIEVIEALTNNEMLMLNRPTFTHSGELLVSGGVVYLNATQNGQQLSINDSEPVTVSIPTEDYLQMDFFDGSFDSIGNFGWDESEDDTVLTNTGNGNQNDTTNFESFFLDFEIDSIGWINCDYFYNSGDPLTGVQVVLPDTFNGENTAVFIYYNDINSVASLSDYDTDGTFDLGAGYSTPVNMDVTFVVVAESNGSYLYALANATITQDHVEIIGSLTEVTEAELELVFYGL
ncbi:MAG: hypothetical protein ACON4E_01475 [Flavobacteriales bacterium]